MCQTNYLSLALWALENVPRLSIVSIFKRQTMRTILYTIFSFPVDFINKPKFQPRPIRLSMIWKLKSNKFITSLGVHQFAKWKKYLFIKKMYIYVLPFHDSVWLQFCQMLHFNQSVFFSQKHIFWGCSTWQMSYFQICHCYVEWFVRFELRFVKFT